MKLGIKLLYLVLSVFTFCASSSVHAKETLPDNIEIEFEGGGQFPRALLAVIKKSEDACKISGRPLPVLNEKELAKHLSVKGKKYYSGSKRYQEYVRWTADVSDCKVKMIEERFKEMNSDEQNILFTYRSDKGGKTVITKRSQLYVERKKSDRAKRFSELSDSNSLWHKKMYPEGMKMVEVNGIPCNEMVAGMICLWSKAPYNLPTGDEIVIKRKTKTGNDALSTCMNAGNSKLDELPLNTLIACSSAYEEKVIRLKSEVAMPAGIFDIPAESKEYPIEYK